MSYMLLETVTDIMDNLNNQARKSIKAILKMQIFQLKKLSIIRKNLSFQNKLQKIRAILKNSGEL